MFAHVSIGVTDFGRSLAFYDSVMNALGYDRLFGDEKDGFMAYGPEDSFFIINLPLDESKKAQAGNGTHLCLKAATQARVDSFYAEAMARGAACAGKPGLRPHYSKDYYAAFILDPDGHKIEAMTKI
jgi:catechol 2,3-dioxygenase-like lactoylglutathione lyase family enzyme